MASKITIDNILIRNHIGNYSDPIQLEITFSNSVALDNAIEWKIIYFGSAEDESCDQVLQQFEIPPVEQVQTMKFQLSCQPPDFSKVPRQELLCVTAMIITVSYKSQQFIRIGYYVHYQYCGDQLPETLINIPAHELIKNTKRTILFDKPRVTKFNIKWDDQSVQSSESQREDKISATDEKQNQDESEEKHQNNYQKLSTMQEKSSNSNNFSNQQQPGTPIECE